MATEREAGLDAARITELARLLGAKRLGELVDILDARLNHVAIHFRDQPGDNHLIDAVHQSRGSASNLGLPRLAEALGQFEGSIKAAAHEFAGDAGADRDRQAQLSRTMSAILSEMKTSRSSVMRLIGIADQ